MILILISGVFSYIRIKNTLINEAYTDIEADLNGYIYLIESNENIDFNQSSIDFGKYTGIRITVIEAASGKVLGDSFNDIETMDNHRARQ